jgi:hypothetical protein
MKRLLRTPQDSDENARAHDQDQPDEISMADDAHSSR